jgi:DNA-binding MarR family transcriptional regulator
MSDASRLIDRLEKKGVIEKFPSDFDRRSNRVRISEEGVKLLTNINSQQEKLDLFIHDRLEEKEVNDLNELLSRLK